MTKSLPSPCRSGDVTSLCARLPAALAAVFIVAIGLSASAQNSSGKADENPTLPAGQGRDVMLRVCSQCHEPEMAADQEFDEAGWKSVVDQMAGKGASATETEFNEIVRYLATAFPVAK